MGKDNHLSFFVAFGEKSELFHFLPFCAKRSNGTSETKNDLSE